MESLKLNETPVRTSRNFNINNIKLENIEIPKNVPEFSNIEIIGKKINIDNTKTETKLKYGLSEKLTNQVNANSNQNMQIKIESKTNQETQINFNFDNQNNTLIENLKITAEENSKATLIIKYEEKEAKKSYHNGIINILAQKESNLNIILINLLNTNSNNFLTIQNTIQENAKINYTIIDFGGKNSITNYYADLKGQNSENTINTIYLGKENQLFDINYIANLKGKKSKINIEVQGALKDNSKKHFKGTIDFKKGCKKAEGNENESCILLSDTAKSISLPMLLCSEEEVEGNHSCSSGKLEQNQLFYIMSRGFTPKEAMKLMVRARFNKIIENIKNEEIKNTIINEIDKRLD